MNKMMYGMKEMVMKGLITDEKLAGLPKYEIFTTTMKKEIEEYERREILLNQNDSESVKITLKNIENLIQELRKMVKFEELEKENARQSQMLEKIRSSAKKNNQLLQTVEIQNLDDSSQQANYKSNSQTKLIDTFRNSSFITAIKEKKPEVDSECNSKLNSNNMYLKSSTWGLESRESFSKSMKGFMNQVDGSGLNAMSMMKFTSVRLYLMEAIEQIPEYI
jgi:hypothetical protein